MSKGYAEIHLAWSNGDTLELSLPMQVQKLRANPKVLAHLLPGSPNAEAIQPSGG
jgi:DUF1680 family protein